MCNAQVPQCKDSANLEALTKISPNALPKPKREKKDKSKDCAAILVDYATSMTKIEPI